MFSTFLEDSDYTLTNIINELREEANDNRMVKAYIPYQRYANSLDSIADALETSIKLEGVERGGTNSNRTETRRK